MDNSRLLTNFLSRDRIIIQTLSVRKLIQSFLIVVGMFILGCGYKSPNIANTTPDDLSSPFSQYSQSVKDTFYITVALPPGYSEETQRRYPLVIVLDGNFYFPMMSSITKEYAVAGLLNQQIVVGVGYKSFHLMDSLRVRDYLFPKPLPSDELSGDAEGLNFYNYLTRELLPVIKNQYRTDNGSCSLLGHSFGGYFVLFALLTELKNNASNFSTFISASPSLWYNDFYLNQLPDYLSKQRHKKLNLLISVGALEDSTWSVKPVANLANEINKRNIKDLQFRSHIYDHLDHMDVPLTSFTRGLRDFMVARDTAN